MKFIGKKISSGPMVRDVTRPGGHVRKLDGGKKATSLKTTLACGHGRSVGNANGQRAGDRAREILRQMTDAAKAGSRVDSKA